MADPGVILLDPTGRVVLGHDLTVTPITPGEAVTGCCDCTSSTTLYAQACPCGSVWTGDDTPNDCMVPDPDVDTGACIMVDLRSVLADMPVRLGMRLFGFWVPRPGGGSRYIGPVIKVGEHCYRFVPPANLYAPASSTAAQRASALAALTPPGALDPSAIVDLLPGLAVIGGDGVLIPVVAGCGPEYGCGPTAPGPEFREAFACDGQHNGVRWFVCARVASAGQTFGCRCISRGRGYSAAEVALIQAAAPGQVFVFYDEPVWDLYWAYSAAHPTRRPAPSCCFCLSAFQGSVATCLSGRAWSNVWGVDRWAYTEVCCGRQDGFQYRVVLRYTRHIETQLTPTVSTVTDITVTMDRVVRRSENVYVAEGTQTIRSTRSDSPQVVVEVGPVEVLLNEVCCLYPAFDHHMVPTIGYLVQDGSTFTDHDGAVWPWSQLELPPPDPTGLVGDRENQLRDAWNHCPWGVVAPVVALSGGGSGDGVYTGSGTLFGDCRSCTFRLNESLVDSVSSQTVSINFKLESVPDNSAPCGYIGLCGTSGWSSRDITELVP